MGRRKISIAPIQDDRNRNVTFGKRRNGLFKKAYELGVLCQVDIAVMVWSHTGKLHIFSSTGNIQAVLDRYGAHGAANTDLVTPNTYGDENVVPGGLKSVSGHATSQTSGKAVPALKAGKNNKKRRRSDSDDDDEDDEDDDDDEDVEQLKPNQNRQSTQPLQAPPSNYSSISPPEHSSQNLQPPSYPQNMSNSMAQQQQQGNMAASTPYMPYPGFMPPMFPGYPYPGAYPNIPNVNPALGNALAGFYHHSPSQQAAAYAAAAVATSQYGPPAHYMSDFLQRQQQQQQQYQQQQQQALQSVSSSPHVQHQMELASVEPQRSSSMGVIGDSRRPALQVTTSNPSFQQIQPESNLRQEEGRRSQMQDRPSDNENHHGFNDAANGNTSEDPGNASGQYDDGNDRTEGQNFLEVPGSNNFPEPFINSPSTLFPEMYRNFTHMQHMQAMGMSINGFDATSPGEIGGSQNAGEGEDTAFRWPSAANEASTGGPVKQEDGQENGPPGPRRHDTM